MPKNGVFSEKGVTDLGGTPAPPFTDKIRKVVFDGFLYGTTVINTISHEMHVQQDACGYFSSSSFMVEENTLKSEDISQLGQMRPFV